MLSACTLDIHSMKKVTTIFMVVEPSIVYSTHRVGIYLRTGRPDDRSHVLKQPMHVFSCLVDQIFTCRIRQFLSKRDARVLQRVHVLSAAALRKCVSSGGASVAAAAAAVPR